MYSLAHELFLYNSSGISLQENTNRSLFSIISFMQWKYSTQAARSIAIAKLVNFFRHNIICSTYRCYTIKRNKISKKILHQKLQFFIADEITLEDNSKWKCG